MIAFDAVASGSVLPGSSITISHTCGTGSTILLVGITESGAVSGSISSITYNGVAMTLITSVQNGGGNLKTWMYKLINPSVGVHDIVINFGTSDFYRAVSISYTGVLQSAQPDNSATNSANAGTTLTTNLTTVADNCWNVSLQSADNTLGMTPSTGVVSNRVNQGSAIYFGDENAALTPAGSYSMTWTCSAQNLAAIQVSLAPALTSPSASASASKSPSASLSPSASKSPSASASSSPSASLSPSSSSSASASKSASASASASLSPSGSLSPSASSSASASKSASASISPSASISSSASPSPGFADYTRDEVLTLPTNDNDLSTVYTDQEVIDVSTYDGVRVGQVGMMKYMIHQFKLFRDDTDPTVLCRGQSTLAPSLSPVYLQVYNHTSLLWETLDSDSTTGASSDFRLAGDITDFSNYKDADQVVSCRVWQLSI